MDRKTAKEKEKEMYGKEPIIIMDNVECMKILTEIGIVDQLVPEPPYTRAHTFFEYRNCHCVATYDKGHNDEKDNGFSVVMIPYDLMPIEESHKLLEELMRATALGPGIWREKTLGKERQ